MKCLVKKTLFLSSVILSFFVLGFAPIQYVLSQTIEQSKAKEDSSNAIRSYKATLDSVRARAQAILDSIKADGDFGEYAKRYSQDEATAPFGGDLGFARRGELVKEFEDAVFALEEGELSGIVQTSLGFHIIQLLERSGDLVHARHILLKWRAHDYVESQVLWEKLTDQVGILYQQGSYAEAIPIAEKALHVAEATFGSDYYAETATSLSNLALLYDALGRSDEAELLFKKALSIRENTFVDDNPYIATSLNNLAALYLNQARCGEAEPLLKRALKIREVVLGVHHPDVAVTLNNLASSYYMQGRYSEAELLLKRALEIKEVGLGAKHPDVATSLTNLAELYRVQGRFNEAEPLFKWALEIMKVALGADHPNVATLLNNLAELYRDQGRYKEAEPLYKRVLSIREKALGADHPYVGTLKNNLATLYLSEGRFSEAETEYKQALAILERALNVDNPTLASLLSNLAVLCYAQSRYNEAEPLYKRALSISEKIFGAGHPSVATFLNNLAELYRVQGRYNEAEPLFRRALFIIEKALNADHPSIANTLNNLAGLYSDQGRYSEAKPLFLRVQQHTLNSIAINFPSLSEKEKTEFYKITHPYFELFNSFAFVRNHQNPEMLGQTLDNQLATKALLFSATSKVNRFIRNSGDTSLTSQFNSWLSTKEYLAKVYTLTKNDLAERGIDVDSLQQVANDMEKELSRRSEAFKKGYEKKLVTWQEVQTMLRQDEAAVEIIRFKLYDKRWTDTVYYAALIVTKETKDHPELVLLNNGNELESTYLEKYDDIIKGQVAVGGYTREYIEKILSELYTQYWQKIQTKLKGIDRVYLSVDGVYNQISLGTLRNPETGKYLLEEMDLRLVTNTKDLVTNAKRGSGRITNTAELFGYPNYGLQQERQELLATNYERRRDVPIYGRTADSLQRFGASPLPGSKAEVEEIQRLLQSAGWNTTEHLGDDALEEAVKVVRSPSILMISTHGFFLSDVEKGRENEMLFGMQSQRVMENPLLRSGLILAGANRTLMNTDSIGYTEKADNGILTAYEAMNLDLDSTELVVLSACETGRGEIKNGEGVYGLQRAFQVAGARSVLMSLWKVSDEATRELMTTFFKNWLSGTEKHEAFKQAQLQLKQNYPEPYYWGAFVMVGE